MALIPGVLLEEKSIGSLSNNIDKTSLLKLMANKPAKDYGLVDLYASKSIKDIPLYAGIALNKNIEYVDGGNFTFSLATAGDTSTKIIENPNKDISKLGEKGVEFTLVLSNGNLGGYGAILTLDKMSNAPELEVTGVKSTGDKWTYRLKIVQGSGFTQDKFIPSEYLTPGTKLFKQFGSGSKEWGQNHDSFSFSGSPTEKKFMKQLATAKTQVHYAVTKEAIKLSNCQLSDYGNRTMSEWKNSVTEYLFFDQEKGPIDPQIKYASEMTGGSQAARNSKSYTGSGVIYTLDNICIDMLTKEDNNVIMYGKGGIVGYGDGLDKGRYAMGIYHQLDKSGYKDLYDINSFGIETILGTYRRFTSGKQRTSVYGAQPVVRVRTGKAGLRMVSPLIEKYTITSLGSFQQQSDKLGIIEGSARTGLTGVKAFYNSLVIPGEVEFRFEYEPSFDPINSNDLFNPLVNGYRLSSYTFLMDDYVMTSDNIKIMRPSEEGNDLYYRYHPGTGQHPFFAQSFNGAMGGVSTGNFTGFRMDFERTVSTPWVVDPTKLAKLVPKNPRIVGASL